MTVSRLLAASALWAAVLAPVCFAEEASDKPVAAAVLPGTKPLTTSGDIALQLVDGVDRFLLGEIEWFLGPHAIHGAGTFDFLHRHLNWPKRQ